MALTLTWTRGVSDSHHARVGRFRISVMWDGMAPRGEPTGYKVTFANATLEKRFGTLDEAKEAGVRLATKVIKDAAETLGIC